MRHILEAQRNTKFGKSVDLGYESLPSRSPSPPEFSNTSNPLPVPRKIIQQSYQDSQVVPFNHAQAPDIILVQTAPTPSAPIATKTVEIDANCEPILTQTEAKSVAAKTVVPFATKSAPITPKSVQNGAPNRNVIQVRNPCSGQVTYTYVCPMPKEGIIHSGAAMKMSQHAGQTVFVPRITRQPRIVQMVDIPQAQGNTQH